MPTQRLAARKLDEILSRINDCAYQPTRIATVAEFAARWREEVLAKRKPSTVRSANSQLDSHILPQLAKLRLDQVGPENQQVFVNQLAGASRKTVLNILSTLSSMLATAKNWGFSSGEIALRKLVLPERNVHVPAHFTRSQVESILSLANEPWRTFFIVLALTGLRAGEALGLQWPDIYFHHKCIHVRRSAWYGKAQSTKSEASAAPVTLPDALASVLRQYHSIWAANPEGWLFATRTTGLRRAATSWNTSFGQSSTRSIFRDASFIVDAGYSPEVAKQQVRHTDARTTLNYIHLQGGITERAMADVSNSLKLDAVGRGQGKGNIQ